MEEVSIRELRNHGGEVIDRVVRGQRITITRDGRPVAELRALGPLGLPVHLLLERWSRLPAVDPDGLRTDVDAVVDPQL
jgi:antitoxin (DNA-binding transcriptional repressor) of toxin-antitoxin stability system